jgi:hypothetical protein
MRVRAVLVPLRRPVITGIGRFDQWSLILVDLETSSGIVGRNYIATYRATAIPSIVAELRDLAATFQGTAVAPYDTLAMIAEQGRLAWQVSTGYGQRYLAETTMGRYRTLIGPRLRARGFAAQQTESAISVAVLNWMLVAGRPDSVRRQPVTA